MSWRLVAVSSITRMRAAMPRLLLQGWEYEGVRTAWPVTVHAPCSLVPQQDIALEILPDDGVCGGRLEDIRHELHTLLGFADDGTIEELGFPGPVAVKERGGHNSPFCMRWLSHISSGGRRLSVGRRGSKGHAWLLIERRRHSPESFLSATRHDTIRVVKVNL